MKTVYQVQQEYKNKINRNVTPIFGFKVGDKVKPSPKESISGFLVLSGKIVGVDGSKVTVELEPGSYNTDTIDETWLMPVEE